MVNKTLSAVFISLVCLLVSDDASSQNIFIFTRPTAGIKCRLATKKAFPALPLN